MMTSSLCRFGIYVSRSSFQQRFGGEGDEGKQCQQGRDRERRDILIVIVKNFNLQRHGRGLPAKNARRLRIGHGLEVMRYRAQLVGAEFHLDSTPGAGTRVVCHLISVS